MGGCQCRVKPIRTAAGVSSTGQHPQLVDTAVIQTLVWSGPLSLEKLVTLVVSSYVVKLVVAVALTPLIYAAHRAVESGLGIAPLKHSAES